MADKCPGHKGTAKYGGCPVPDSDGDGVNDDADKCPFVEGPVTNNGCPEFKEPVVPVSKDTLRFTIYFEQAKSELKTNGFNTLTEVVRLMKANPKLVAQFNGHTDTHGSVEANSIRAFSRASVCADYVASFFINRSRLIVAAYSNRAPAADLNIPSMQWKNRRVEILLYEK
ncbi:MAG TPA: OmpA family protein [Ferruginibacter sp.]|nr:OmpA family protein [Ferruginibacter sp.]